MTFPFALTLFFFCFQKPMGRDVSALNGVWVNTTYAHVLANTYSPQEARKTPSGCTAYLQIEDGRAWWLNCFHDSDEFQILDSLSLNEPHFYFFKRIRLLQRGYNYTLHRLIFDPANPDDLIWQAQDSSTIHFNRMAEPLLAYINRLVITGTYHDSDGRAYSFSDSGTVDWAGSKLPYFLGLDWYGTDRDYVSIGKEYFGFVRSSSSLLLSPAVFSDDSERLLFDTTKVIHLFKVN